MSKSFRTKPSTRRTKYLTYDSSKYHRLHSVWLDALSLDSAHTRKLIEPRLVGMVENRA